MAKNNKYIFGLQNVVMKNIQKQEVIFMKEAVPNQGKNGKQPEWFETQTF